VLPSFIDGPGGRLLTVIASAIDCVFDPGFGHEFACFLYGQNREQASGFRAFCGCPVAPQDQIQDAVFAHIRARGVPGLAIHPANGGYRKPVEAKILAGLGVTAGAPDVLLWHAGKSFALELKSETGRTSPAQAEMLDRLKGAGVLTGIAHGIDDALIVLQGWQLLRGQAQ
jgi:VRR-NUC domain